ncbi:MAG TPA: hypothetical protein VLT83_07660 [Opitutaceae bacterium]|nr:hypothetical protein [Opitutaceae bacterium]
MKTLFSTLSIFALTLAATSLDAYPLDGGTWLTAAMVAALFGLALNDSRRSASGAARSV